MVGQAQAQRGTAAAEQGCEIGARSTFENDGQPARPEARCKALGGGRDNGQGARLVE